MQLLQIANALVIIWSGFLPQKVPLFNSNCLVNFPFEDRKKGWMLTMMMMTKCNTMQCTIKYGRIKQWASINIWSVGKGTEMAENENENERKRNGNIVEMKCKHCRAIFAHANRIYLCAHTERCWHTNDIVHCEITQCVYFKWVFTYEWVRMWRFSFLQPPALSPNHLSQKSTAMNTVCLAGGSIFFFPSRKITQQQPSSS